MLRAFSGWLARRTSIRMEAAACPNEKHHLPSWQSLYVGLLT